MLASYGCCPCISLKDLQSQVFCGCVEYEVVALRAFVASLHLDFADLVGLFGSSAVLGHSGLFCGVFSSLAQEMVPLVVPYVLACLERFMGKGKG